jgi:hypothetical protein
LEMYLYGCISFVDIQLARLLTVVAVLSKVDFLLVPILHALAENIIYWPVVFKVLEAML